VASSKFKEEETTSHVHDRKKNEKKRKWEATASAIGNTFVGGRRWHWSAMSG